MTQSAYLFRLQIWSQIIKNHENDPWSWWSLSQASYFLRELNSSKAARIPWLLDCYTTLTRYGFTEAYHSAFAGGIPVVWSFLMVNMAGVVAVQALSHFFILFNICRPVLFLWPCPWQQNFKQSDDQMFMIQKSITTTPLILPTMGFLWFPWDHHGLSSDRLRSPEVGCLKASMHWSRSWISIYRLVHWWAVDWENWLLGQWNPVVVQSWYGSHGNPTGDDGYQP